MSTVELDTKALTVYSEKLTNLTTTNADIINKLYSLDKNFILTNTLKFDLEVIGNAIKCCAAYLLDTAEDYAIIETEIEKALKTGKYTLTEILPPIVPPHKPGFDKITYTQLRKKEAADELFRLLRDGKLDKYQYFKWLLKYFVSDPDIAESIFGREIPCSEQFNKFLKFIFDLTEDLWDIADAGISITEIVDGKELDIKGLDNLSQIVSILGALEADYDLAFGIVALIIGKATNDEVMISSGCDYLDDSISSIGDVILAFWPVGGPYGFLISLGVNSAVNSVTNIIECGLTDASPAEWLWATQISPTLETLNDTLCGNFLCQLYVQKYFEDPLKFCLEASFDLRQSVTGYDIRSDLDDFPLLDYIYNNDNWLKDLYEFADDRIDDPLFLKIFER